MAKRNVFLLFIFVLVLVGVNYLLSFPTTVYDQAELIEEKTATMEKTLKALKTELDRVDALMAQISAKAFKKELDRVDTSKKELLFDEAFITMIPGYGPNNQYIGLQDVMYIAKVLNRTLGLPYFFEHHVTGPESLRPFEKTFDPAYISKYQKTVNFSEFKKRCTGVVETLVWMIDDMRPWTLVTNSWKTGVGMTITNNKEAPKRLAFTDNSQIFEWFKDVKKQKCLAVAYPFRTVRPIPERRSLSLYLVHDHWIKEVASNALKEIRAQPERMLSIHWRWGETTCARWLSPEPNPDFDFCWGTSVFHYARYSDVFSSLKSLIKKAHITHIFLAVSLKYHDRLIFEKFFDDMKRENISVITSASLQVLRTYEESLGLGRSVRGWRLESDSRFGWLVTEIS
eukprot:TRINITY_DN2181_c0_g1_i1.p1 TRINITY_DN2181_c0_g1~~TRINITY_DN2181_c0_g1_i1.p1  ORF type:complete len:399 (+),score=69.66 TRINITY_DN2181_c0_g1_i1:63-1259(+)